MRLEKEDVMKKMQYILNMRAVLTEQSITAIRQSRRPAKV